MNNWEIIYKTKNGFEGSVVIAAANKFAAWESFEIMANEFGDEVCEADCHLLLN